MDMSILISAGIGTAVTTVLAVVLAIAISVVTQCFHVRTDPRIEQIYDILPHINCGACGHPGCMPYAKSIINEDEKRNKCRPGGPVVAEKILDLLDEK